MALNLGDPASLVHDLAKSDATVSAITAPTAGLEESDGVTITFTLQSFEVTSVSVTVYYSTDGVTWPTATITEAITALAASEAGTEHTLTWESPGDIGANDRFPSVQIAVEVDDIGAGGGDDDRFFRSPAFVVDNLPGPATWTDPATGEFQKTRTKKFELTMPTTNPGTLNMFPYITGDMVTSYDSSKVFTVDGQDGTDHIRFYRQVALPTDKPIAGYLVQDVTVSGSTTVTFSGQTDYYTLETLPTTITNARCIIIQKADRRVYQVSISDTQVVLNESASGFVADGLVDLFIMTEAQSSATFFVKSGISVPNTAAATTSFASLGNDDYGNDITDTFGTAPRVIIIDEADRMAILGAVTTTGFDLRKSIAGATSNGTVTAFIVKTDTDVYQDDAYTSAGSSLATVLFSALTDSQQAISADVSGAIVCPVPVADRHAYVGTAWETGVQIARSLAGSETTSVDVNIWTKTDAASIWIPMTSAGISSTYLGDKMQWRPTGTEWGATDPLSEGTWYAKIEFGNVA